jgi:DNA repair photolyase
MPAPPPNTRTKDNEALPDLPRKGRGSVSNQPSHRFDVADRYEIDDGWSDHEREDWAKARRKTILSVDTVRHIITRNTSPDIHFDRSINPYKGCEHGCIYCFARPTHAYLDLSPGMDFETRIFRKPDAAEALRRELSARSYTPAPIALGINTDAYQPTERSEKLTRAILQVLYEFRHPVHIVTKSALIQRDLDILAPMAELRLFKATLSVTTLDRDLARIMEPRAATPMKRLETVRILSAAGIPTSVLVAPVIPGLTDHEIEAILGAAAAHGAVRAGGALIRLPHEIKTLFEEWLRTHFPDRADKVLNLIRQCRDGKLYNAEFGSRMRGTGPYAELIQKRLSLGIKRYALDKPSPSFDLSIFRGGDPQMSLF